MLNKRELSNSYSPSVILFCLRPLKKKKFMALTKHIVVLCDGGIPPKIASVFDFLSLRENVFRKNYRLQPYLNA